MKLIAKKKKGGNLIPFFQGGNAFATPLSEKEKSKLGQSPEHKSLGTDVNKSTHSTILNVDKDKFLGDERLGTLEDLMKKEELSDIESAAVLEYLNTKYDLQNKFRNKFIKKYPKVFEEIDKINNIKDTAERITKLDELALANSSVYLDYDDLFDGDIPHSELYKKAIVGRTKNMFYYDPVTGKRTNVKSPIGTSTQKHKPGIRTIYYPYELNRINVYKGFDKDTEVIKKPIITDSGEFILKTITKFK